MTLFSNLEQFKNRIFTTYSEGGEHTYGDVIGLSDTIFSHIGHRTLIFCLCKNQPGALAGYISFLRNNIVPLMLDASLNRELLNELLNKYKPEYLWLPNEQVPTIERSNLVFSILNYSLVKLEWENTINLAKDLAMLLTTSGSTGSPKLVRLSHNNILANAMSIAEYLEINEDERPITSLPIHYSFGLSIINSHLLKGANILLTDRSVVEKEFWLFLREHKATSFSGVPYTYQILKRLRYFNMELPSIKTLTQAGGKLNDKLNKEYSEHSIATNKRFFVMYGQTEATARMGYLPIEYTLTKLGSIGIPIPGGEFSLANDLREEIKNPGEIGELVYKGENVSLGYAECVEDLSKGDENGGVLYTGDLAYFDKDGFFYVVGRKKRFIKIYGNRINLDHAERMLEEAFSGCACIGNDDKMIIYTTNEAEIKNIKVFISSKMKINHAAFSVRYIEKIPKNSSGKTVYSKLRI